MSTSVNNLSKSYTISHEGKIPGDTSDFLPDAEKLETHFGYTGYKMRLRECLQ